MSKSSEQGFAAVLVFAVLVIALFSLLVGVGLIPFVAVAFGVHLPFWPTLFTVMLANMVFGKSAVQEAKGLAK